MNEQKEKKKTQEFNAILRPFWNEDSAAIEFMIRNHGRIGSCFGMRTKNGSNVGAGLAVGKTISSFSAIVGGVL